MIKLEFCLNIFFQKYNFCIKLKGQSGEDVTFLLLVDKGASLQAVNAFGDGLAAFQVFIYDKFA